MMRLQDPLELDNMPTLEYFNEVVYQAEMRDKDAHRELEHILDSNPVIWQELGDLTSLVERELIQRIAGRSVVAAATLQRNIASMRAELSGHSPSPLRRLVVDRVISSWLDLQLTQTCAAEPRTRKTDDSFWQKKVDASQRRHFLAVKQLEEMQDA